MSVSKRERILIIVVALLALVGAYYMWYLKPCMEEMKTLNSDNSSKEIQISANEQRQNQFGQLEVKIADIEEQIALYGDSIAQAFDQPPVLVYLSDTVSTYAQKGTIYFEEPEQIGQIEHCAITVTMTSTYNGLKKTLDAFSEAPYLIRVTQLSATIPTADSGSSTVTESNTATTTTPEVSQTVEAVPEVLEVKLVLDFYSLSGEIPAGTTYTFDTDRQYGGDIFY